MTGEAGETARAARPTSRDVARAAGVSQATVSLVLGDKWRGRVSAATADGVRAAAGELGYRPNLAARSLRTGRTRTALLVVPALTHEYFARVYAGAAAVAAEHGFGVVLYPSPQGVGPARDPFGSAQTAIDGVIASSMAADALAGIGGGGLPLVMLDSDPSPAAGASAPPAGAGPTRTPGRAQGPVRPGSPAGPVGPVGPEEAAGLAGPLGQVGQVGQVGPPTVNLAVADGIRQVARHLVALGHRRITHLAADVDSWTFRVRAEAVREVLAGVPGARLAEERCALDVGAARDAALRALRVPGRAGGRPTALLCDGDLLAAGAYKAARALGLRVPDELSVSGFDDLALASALEPEVTSVRLPAEEVGAHGMRALLALFEGAPTAPVELAVQLVVRGSTGPPAPRSAPAG